MNVTVWRNIFPCTYGKKGGEFPTTFFWQNCLICLWIVSSFHNINSIRQFNKCEISWISHCTRFRLKMCLLWPIHEVFAIALYDYIPNEPHQLRLEQNCEVLILGKEGANRGWWRGRIHETVMFVLNFVSVFKAITITGHVLGRLFSHVICPWASTTATTWIRSKDSTGQHLYVLDLFNQCKFVREGNDSSIKYLMRVTTFSSYIMQTRAIIFNSYYPFDTR